MKKISVLVVDDSELIRSLLTSILSSDAQLEVVGAAEDPLQARDMIKKLNPDVVTLDIEMPKMDGITFLKNIMRLRPTPVVMISTLTEKGAEITLEALSIGAVDFVAKPKVDPSANLQAMAGIICAKVKQAARVKVDSIDAGVGNPRAKQSVDPRKFSKSALDLIVIGASTGGTLALKEVLSGLPEMMPPIAVVQHMPEKFTASFASRLDKECDLRVVEMNEEGQKMEPGHVYIANGGQHMRIMKRGLEYRLYGDDGPAVNRHKPSVDVLFDSVAALRDAHTVAVLLTGMGADGANGMGNLKDIGAVTVAQDEHSSIVWGMPRVAVEMGVVDHVLPLTKISGFLTQRCYRK